MVSAGQDLHLLYLSQSAVTPAVQCSSEYALSTLTIKFGNGRAEFASAGFISDVPLNILLNRYLYLYLTASCLKNQPYKD